MPRKARRQPIGVPLHLIARGHHGRPIFRSAESKQHLLDLLTDVAERYRWDVMNWVVMTNHLHLLVQLHEPTLSVGMKRLLGLRAQRWNWSNEERGHVFMGRYRSIEIDNGGYLATVSRYIDLNPVRAGLCRHPSDYIWSGYAGNAGIRLPEAFHHAGLGCRAVSSHVDVSTARARYRRFVCMKVPAWARQGHEFEERPALVDILRPGRVDSWAEATGLWWYTAHEIAEAYGVTDRTVRQWVKDGKPPRPLLTPSRLP